MTERTLRLVPVPVARAVAGIGIACRAVVAIRGSGGALLPVATGAGGKPALVPVEGDATLVPAGGGMTVGSPRVRAAGDGSVAIAVPDPVGNAGAAVVSVVRARIERHPGFRVARVGRWIVRPGATVVAISFLAGIAVPVPTVGAVTAVPAGEAVGTGTLARAVAIPGEATGFAPALDGAAGIPTVTADEVAGPVVVEPVLAGPVIARPGEAVIVTRAVTRGRIIPGPVVTWSIVTGPGVIWPIRAGGAGARLAALGGLVLAPGLATAAFEAGSGGHGYISSGASIPRIASPFASVCRVAATRARRADRVGSPDWRTGQA